MTSHEPITNHSKVASSSDRSFGYTFSFVFLLVGLWPWIRHGGDIRYWSLALSSVFLWVGYFVPSKLSLFNYYWSRFGFLLHKIVSPIIMSLLFYCAVTPMALVIRLLGKDLLNLRKNSSSTYWISRTPPGPTSGTMKNQY
jgi:hypothetical protein